jgi:hypothetical protein
MPLTEQQVRSVREHGYALEPAFFTARDTAAIQAEVEATLDVGG